MNNRFKRPMSHGKERYKKKYKKKVKQAIKILFVNIKIQIIVIKIHQDIQNKYLKNKLIKFKEVNH